MSIIMFDLNVFCIKCSIDETIDSGLGIKCPVYKMVSIIFYVMYHIKSDIKGVVCIFVKVDNLTNLLSGLSYDCLIPAYELLSFFCHIS